MTKQFIVAFKNGLRHLGISNRYYIPEDLLKPYEGLAQACLENGYSDFINEFDNDIAERNFIEKVLGYEPLQHFSEMKDFVERVRKADMIMKSSFLKDVFREDEDKWWLRGIVKKGSHDYAKDIKTVYGIDLE